MVKDARHEPGGAASSPIERRRDGNAEARTQAGDRRVRPLGGAPRLSSFIRPMAAFGPKPEAVPRLKWMGVLAGVPDLVLMLPRGRCAFWEVKSPIGRLSTDQALVGRKLTALGHACAGRARH